MSVNAIMAAVVAICHCSHRCGRICIDCFRACNHVTADERLAVPCGSARSCCSGCTGVTGELLLLPPQRLLLQQPLPACTVAVGAADTGHELQPVEQVVCMCVACVALGDWSRLEQHIELHCSSGWLWPSLRLSARQLLCWPASVASAAAKLVPPPPLPLQPLVQHRVWPWP